MPGGNWVFFHSKGAGRSVSTIVRVFMLDRPAFLKSNHGRSNNKNSRTSLRQHSGGRTKNKSVWKRIEDHFGEWQQALSQAVNRLQKPIQNKRQNQKSMKQVKRQDLVITTASLHVQSDGTLTATSGDNRFFIVDGLKCFASPEDKEELDVIKPFQINKDGMYDYYTAVCTSDEDANGNAGRPDEGSAENEQSSGAELNSYDDNEDVEDVNITSGSGCTLFMALVFISTLVMVLSIINWSWK